MTLNGARVELRAFNYIIIDVSEKDQIDADSARAGSVKSLRSSFLTLYGMNQPGQVRWSRGGADYLLQVRYAVIRGK
jgi:hypothetical protein